LSLFLTTFFFLYGGMHLYIYLKFRASFHPSIIANIFVGFFIVAMILAPIFVRMADGAGLEVYARGLAYLAFTWMGATLIFFVTGICIDIFRLLVHISGALLGRNVTEITSAHLIYFSVCLVASLFVIIYGSFEARNVRAEHIVIKTNKISAAAGRIRIAQISDVHLGLIVGEDRLNRIIQVVQHAKPDILVSTGDLLDGQPDRVDLLVDRFNDIDVPHGKFAVTGNHEVYLDRSHHDGLSRKLTEKAGFRLLSNSVIPIPGLITLAGVDDEAVRGWRHGDSAQEASLCSKIDVSQFTVLLKHRPVPYTGQLCTYDLQLSGHTHKGQIFPFFFITRIFFKQYAGLYELGNKSHLYVSRGSGTWGPPIRFLAPPEVTIIDLVRKAN
jgi:uncharacterized protein